jgi:hypothetical protein
MKPKSASTHSNKFSRGARDLPGRMAGRRKFLLGLGAVAVLFLNGCATDSGVSYATDSGYYPYSGPYYGDYGPYYGDDGPYYGGEFVVGGGHHSGHYGGHHFAGSSFGRGGFGGFGGGHGGSGFHGGGGGGHGGGGGGGHGR